LRRFVLDLLAAGRLLHTDRFAWGGMTSSCVWWLTVSTGQSTAHDQTAATFR
jgi:hypothetical protein